MDPQRALLLACSCLALLQGCRTSPPADAARAEPAPAPAPPPREPWASLGAEEELSFLGTEPFWSGSVHAGTLSWVTPDHLPGERAPATRVARAGALELSATVGGQPLRVTVTRQPCSDGMSDRRYPLTVTVQHGTEQRQGCAWSEGHPFDGPDAP